MSTNEVNKYIQKYMTGDNDWLFPNNSNADYLGFIKTLGKCCHFEAPDLYCVYGKKILIVEHFRFDSSKTSRKKGSDERKKEAENLRNIDKTIKNAANGEIVNGSFYSKRKSEYYLNNLQNAFEEHYKRITQYKFNICNSLNLDINKYKFIIAFIIEDVSSFGNVCLDKEPKIILPVNVKEFLDYYAKKPGVDFLVCSSETFKTNGTITHLLASGDIENARKNSVSIIGKELADLEINTISGNIFIPFTR